jgi:hypothetical protein
MAIMAISFANGAPRVTSASEGKVIYRSREEAERETGYFSVYYLKMDEELSKRVCDYITSAGLTTYMRENKRKTSLNYYTLNFILRLYYKDPKSDLSIKYGILSAHGALGWLKPGLATKRSSYTNRSGEFPVERIFVHGPSQDHLDEVEALEEKTPDLDQMYFWICRKYPDGILWVSYGK